MLINHAMRPVMCIIRWFFMTEINFDQLREMIAKAPFQSVQRAVPELYQGAQLMMNESQKLVPFKLGALSASGIVELPKVVGNVVIEELGYGGPAVAYAIVQHERLDYQHAPGRQAKYLEQPVLALVGQVMNKLGEKLGTIFQR